MSTSEVSRQAATIRSLKTEVDTLQDQIRGLQDRSLAVVHVSTCQSINHVTCRHAQPFLILATLSSPPPGNQLEKIVLGVFDGFLILYMLLCCTLNPGEGTKALSVSQKYFAD